MSRPRSRPLRRFEIVVVCFEIIIKNQSGITKSTVVVHFPLQPQSIIERWYILL
jgi:hypothetical protein